MSFEVFGVLLAAIIQGVIISIYGSAFSCDSLNANYLHNSSNVTTPLYTTTSSSYNKLVNISIISSYIKKIDIFIL
jgi:hypothetical protein